MSVSGFLGCVVLLVLLVVALCAPWLAPHDPVSQETTSRLLPPVWDGGESAYPLGTDGLGRDVLSRLIFGARISFLVGFGTVAIAGTVGLLLGLISGYVGGRLDSSIQTLSYAQLSLPIILVALAIISAFGPGLSREILVLSLAGWVPFCRVIRGAVLSTKERQFVEAARMIGATDWRIMRVHIVPQIRGVFLILVALQVGQMILFDAALSYLGLGVQPPTPSWGSMISDAGTYLYTSPWLSVFPGAAIALTVLAVMAAGRGISELIDPKGKHMLRSVARESTLRTGGAEGTPAK
jgi:peptide/nickel transport system permease protein